MLSEIEKEYGCCKHGILPFLGNKDNSIERCLVCKYERGYKYYTTDKGRFSIISSAHRRRAAILKVPGSYTEKEWKERFEYWGKKCVVCEEKLPFKDVEIDHLIPITWKGSSNNAWNLAPICKPCNISKGNRYALFEHKPKELIAVYK